MKGPCVFCRIVGGEMPGSRVLETDLIVAFLDIRPEESSARAFAGLVR